MEFTRRRRRRGGRSARNGRMRSGAGRAVIAMLMVAAVVYLISASAAGTWLAENLMAPVFEALAARGREKEDIQSQSSDEVQQVSLSTAASSISADIDFPALSCYALQMGVFASEENAENQAAQLKNQGAGGYVLQDGDRYRVLAAGYALESEAKEVKDRLIGEGMDCTVFTISSPGATFRVNAEESQIDEVRSGFTALHTAQAALTEAAIAFDRDGMSVADGQAAVQAIQLELEQNMAGLSAYGDSSPALASLLACKERFCAELSTLAQNNAASHTAYSAAMKYAQLSLTKSYSDMAASLTA